MKDWNEYKAFGDMTAEEQLEVERIQPLLKRLLKEKFPGYWLYHIPYEYYAPVYTALSSGNYDNLTGDMRECLRP